MPPTTFVFVGFRVGFCGVAPCVFFGGALGVHVAVAGIVCADDVLTHASTAMTATSAMPTLTTASRIRIVALVSTDTLLENLASTD